MALQVTAEQAILFALFMESKLPGFYTKWMQGQGDAITDEQWASLSWRSVEDLEAEVDAHLGTMPAPQTIPEPETGSMFEPPKASPE